MSCSLTSYAQRSSRRLTCSSGAAKALASAELRPSGKERDSKDTRAGAGRRAVRCMCRAGVVSLRAARPPRASYGSKVSLSTSAASRDGTAASEANLQYQREMQLDEWQPLQAMQQSLLYSCQDTPEISDIHKCRKSPGM